MPQNTKDSHGGKNHPGKNGGDTTGKSSQPGRADGRSGSPTGSQNKGEKKTTP